MNPRVDLAELDTVAVGRGLGQIADRPGDVVDAFFETMSGFTTTGLPSPSVGSVSKTSLVGAKTVQDPPDSASTRPAA